MAATKSRSKKTHKAKGSAKKHTKSKHKSSSTLKNLLKSVKKAVKVPHVVKKLPPLEKVDTAFNKARLLSTLAERAELNRKQVSLLLDEFCSIMGLHLQRGGPEKFILPGAFKVVVRKIPAKKARTGVNPFTGQPTVFKAKPATRRVKIIALKGLKEHAK